MSAQNFEDMTIDYFLFEYEAGGNYMTYDEFLQLFRNDERTISKTLSSSLIGKWIKELDKGKISENKEAKLKRFYNKILKIVKQKVGDENKDFANKSLALEKFLESKYATGVRPKFEDYLGAILEDKYATRPRKRLRKQYLEDLSKEAEDKLRKEYNDIMDKLDEKMRKPVKPHGNVKPNPNFRYSELSVADKEKFEKHVAEIKKKVIASRETGNRQNVFKIPGVRVVGGKKGTTSVFNLGNVVEVVRERLSAENIQEIRDNIVSAEMEQIDEIENSDLAEDEKEERREVVIEEAKERISEMISHLTVEENNDIREIIAGGDGDVIIEMNERQELYAQFLLFSEVAQLNMMKGTPINPGFYNNIYNAMDNDIARNLVSGIMRKVSENVGVIARNDDIITRLGNERDFPLNVAENVIREVSGEDPKLPASTFKGAVKEGLAGLAIAGIVAATILVGGFTIMKIASYLVDEKAKKTSKIKYLKKILGVSESSEMKNALEKLKNKGLVPNEVSFDNLITTIQAVSEDDLNNLMENKITPGEFALNFLGDTLEGKTTSAMSFKNIEKTLENSGGISTLPMIAPLYSENLGRIFPPEKPIIAAPPEITRRNIADGLPNFDFNMTGLLKTNFNTTTLAAPPQQLLLPKYSIPKADPILALPLPFEKNEINNNYSFNSTPNIMNFQTAYKTYDDLPEYLKAYMTKEQYEAKLYSSGSLGNPIAASQIKGIPPPNARNSLLSGELTKVAVDKIPRHDGKFLSSFPIAVKNSSTVVMKDVGYQNMIGTATHLNEKGGKKFRSIEYYKEKNLNNENLLGVETRLIKKVKRNPGF